MNKTIKRIIQCMLCVVLFVCSFAVSGCKDEPTEEQKGTTRVQKVEESSLYLTENGASAYGILLREGYDSAEAYAAEEFNRLLNEAAGVTLPITTQAGDSTKYISIGQTSMSEAAKVEPKESEYTRNGFYIKSYQDGLVINASQRSGLLYGVYRFFEKNCGYMYYDVDTFKINRSKTVGLKKFDFQDWPDFINRDVYCYGTRMNPAHTMRLFTSGGQFSKWDAKYGEGSWWATSLDDQSFITALLKKGTYGEQYPEWFYVKPGTSGQDAYPQLCYTEGLYSKEESGIDDFDEVTTDDGSAGMFWTLVYNLIHNHIMVEESKSVFLLGMADNTAYCDCERCTRDVATYEKSGVCVRFLNAVAKEVEKWRLENCPDREIYLSVFAYQGLTIPPVKKVNGNYEPIDDSVLVEDNIMLRYAPAYDYYSFPLMDEEHNPGSTEALLGWSALAKNLCVWDYRAAFYDLICPFPNWLSEYENIKTYKELGFLDVLSQSTSNFDGMPFLNMDNWVRSRLLWDSTLDYDALIYEFTEAYYGEAGVYVREYMDYLTNHYMTYLLDMGRIYNPHYAEQVNSTYFPRGVVNNIEHIFDKMYASIAPLQSTDSALYEKLKAHVDYESVFYRYCQIELYSNFYVSDDLLGMISEFERIQQQIGFTGLKARSEDFATIIADWRKDVLSR